MFKRIAIKLTGPICTRDVQDLVWAIEGDLVRPTLLVGRKSCGTKLIVPSAKFVASFELEQPYPGKKLAKNATILKLVPKPDEEEEDEDGADEG